MTHVSELSYRDYKVIMRPMLKCLMNKADNMKNQLGNFNGTFFKVK